MSFANLPSRVTLGMILEGKAPHSLPPNAQYLFQRALSSAASITTNLDTYVHSNKNIDWLDTINPKSLDIDYDTLAFESTDIAPRLELRTYTHLTKVRINNAKTDSKELDDFLSAHIGTLRQIALQNICLLWTDSNEPFPWMKIILTLRRVSELDRLWLNMLSAYPVGYASRGVDPRASQEVAWKNKVHVRYVLDILFEYYVAQGHGGLWVDLHHVEETMMTKHGITI